MSKVIAIVGYKESGKTSLIEALLEELRGRGLRVGVIKHTTRRYPVDTPGKDTWRYMEAGARASALLTPMDTALFLRRTLELDEVIHILQPLDLVVLEGFKDLDRVPRIILARDRSEVERLRNGLEVAVTGKIAKSNIGELGVPIIDPGAVGALAEIMENKAIPLLPGLNCRKCGYPSCKELARAILTRKAKVSNCVNLPSRDVHIVLDGRPLRINPFVGRILRNVVMGVLSTLKGVETPESVEVKFLFEKKASKAKQF